MRKLTVILAAAALAGVFPAATQAENLLHRNDVNPAQSGFQTAGDLIGTKAEDPQGNSLGTVADLMVDTRSGQIPYIILTRGGVLGVGSTLYPVPWQAFHYNASADRIVVSLSQAQFNGAPNFPRDNWPDLSSSSWQQRIGSYYQVQGSGPVAADHLMRASKMMSKSLRNAQGQRIGTVDNFAVNLRNGTIEYAIVSAGGGVLGINENLHAVPWSAMNYNAGRQELTLDMSKQKIESAPSFKSDNWPNLSDPAWQGQIDRYYGVQSPESGSSGSLRSRPPSGQAQ